MSKLYIILFLLLSCASQGQKKEDHHPVHDLLPINGDTLVAAKWYGGLVVTYNAGKSWTTLSPDLFLKTMTVDKKGVIWGMDSWQGIHESDYSRIYKSLDKGKTWKEATFNTEKFFPLEIVSKPHEPLRIISRDKKEYLLNGNNPLTNWKLVGSYPEWENEVVDGDYKLLRGRKEGTLLKRTSSWDSIYHFNDLYGFDIRAKNDTVFVVGGIGGNGRAYFGYLTKDKKLKEFPIEGMQAYGVRQDSKGRIWMFSTEGIYILNNDKLEKVY